MGWHWGILAASGRAATSWLGIAGSGTNLRGYGVTLDSSGNVYTSGNLSNNIVFAKYDTDGAIQFKRQLQSNGQNDDAMRIAVASSGNIYLSGVSYNATNAYDFQVAKYNSSGTIQWQRRMYRAAGVTNSIDKLLDLGLDSSENVYAVGYSNASGINLIYLVKYNSSGTLQWQKTLGGTGQNSGWAIAVTSSGNCYIGGQNNNNYWQLAKFNSSGTIQWQRQWQQNTQIAGIGLDSSENLYVSGTGAGDFVVAKFNSSGVVQWARKLSGSGTNEISYGSAADSDGNLYAVGYCNQGGSYNIQFAKWNTSGTIQWQRRLTTGWEGNGADIVTDSNGSFYFNAGRLVSSTNYESFGKLPVDGSKTGTYTVGGQSTVYSATTLTESSVSQSSGSTSYSSSDGILTDASTSFTSSTPTYSTSTLKI